MFWNDDLPLLFALSLLGILLYIFSSVNQQVLVGLNLYQD